MKSNLGTIAFALLLVTGLATWPGYAPRDAGELVDWVKERLLVPEVEWRELLEAVERDRRTEGGGGEARDGQETGDGSPAEGPGRAEEGSSEASSGPADGDDPGSGLDAILAAASEHLVRVVLPSEAEAGSSDAAVVAIETLPRLVEALELDPAATPLRSVLASAEATAGSTGASAEPSEGAQIGPSTEISTGAPTATSTSTVSTAASATASSPIGSTGAPTPATVADALRRLEGAAYRPAGPPVDEPLAELVAEWIRFYGPVPRQCIAAAFGLGGARTREVLEALVESETVVIDRFRAVPDEGTGAGSDAGALDEAPIEVCDAENLERLLRILRAAARPTLETRPLDELPLLLASIQGLTDRGGGLADLQRSLERLLGYPAPAGLWERDLLPARLAPYYPSWLDSLMQESDLLWLGCGRERLTFAFPEEVELLRSGDAPSGDEPAPDDGEGESGDRPERLFPDPAGRYSLDDLARHSGRPAAALTERLWRLAWEGKVSNTTFLAVRKGLLARFQPEEEPAARRGSPASRRVPGRRSARRRFERWKSTRPVAGDWFLLQRAVEDGDEPLDALDREELSKDRVRMLLDRYGVLLRELLARELPALAWSGIFRSLRLMELSGEVFSGHFFDGIHGVQFASRAALARLREGMPGDPVWWVNALDPASPCGLGLDRWKGEIPARVPSNHLVFHGARRVVVSKRHGAELEVAVGPDHPRLGDYLEFLKVLLTRRFDPVKAIDVETINGEPAVGSPYATALVERFAATRELQSLRLRRRY